MAVFTHIMPQVAAVCSGVLQAYLPIMAGTAPDNVWVASGDLTVPTYGVYGEYWDGASWTEHLYTAPGFDQIVGMRVLAANDVYLAGQHGIYHWDGVAWATQLTVAAGETIVALLYGGGTLYAPVDRYPLYLDYAKNYYAVPGGSWSSFTFAADYPGFGYGPIGGVMGSLTDAYIAIRGIGAPLYSYINRFDYSAVRRYLNWRLFDNHGDGFRMLYASGPVYALAYNRYDGHLYQNNDTAPNDWTQQTLPAGPASHNLLCGDGVGDTNVWVGGGFSGSPDPDVLYWNGSTWVQTVPTGWGTDGGRLWQTALVSGIRVFSASDVWATGTFVCAGDPYSTWLFVMHWDGATWTQVF